MNDSKTDTLIEATLKLADANVALRDRVTDLEQKLNGREFVGLTSGNPGPDIGRMVTESDAFKSMMSGLGKSARIELKTAIINAVGQNQPLVAADRLAGIVAGPERRLRIRDLLPVVRTDSNLIEYAKENVYTNSAGPQVGGSPQQFENVAKPESGITFTLETAAVTTLAHTIPASRQVLSDSAQLAQYLNDRMVYGLKLVEEQQLLLGTGSNGQLPGLYTNRTAYTKTSPLTYTTKIDVVRDAIRQLQIADFEATGIVLHPTDWAAIEQAKDSQNRYLFANPQSAAQPQLWGVPVIPSNTLTAGTFLVGDFQRAAILFDRMDAVVEVGFVDSQFTKNAITLLCEERLALAVVRPTALIGGSFTV